MESLVAHVSPKNREQAQFVRASKGVGDVLQLPTAADLMQNRGLPDAARLGLAAGTAAVTTPGTELCRREDVERLYEIISQRGPCGGG